MRELPEKSQQFMLSRTIFAMQKNNIASDVSLHNGFKYYTRKANMRGLNEKSLKIIVSRTKLAMQNESIE